MAEAKKQNYLHGAAILAAGVVVLKILGAIYKIPLRNIIGETGYGYFFAAYTIYNFFLTISTAGLPVALSRMISEGWGSCWHWHCRYPLATRHPHSRWW